MGNIPKKLAQFHWLQASLWKVFLLYPAKLNMFFVKTFMLKHCNYKTSFINPHPNALSIQTTYRFFSETGQWNEQNKKSY